MGRIIENCAGIDIGKRFLLCCVLTGGAAEEPRSETLRFEVTVAALQRLREWLTNRKVTHVVMESTGSYWIPLFNILEDHFAIEDTLGDSQPFGAHVWDELRHRLLDFQDQRLRLMDASGVEIMIASLNAPAIQAIPDAKKANEIARKANDYLADAVRKQPDRFQALAALPLQDPDLYPLDVASFILIAGFMWIVGRIALWKSLLTAFLFSVIMFITFDIAFDVIMPKGPLEAAFGR